MRDNTKRSKIPLACGALMLAAVGIWAVSKACGTGSGDIPGATNEQRTAYIESFGWDPGITHTDVSEIRIPVEFDEVYEEYNDLQKKQGNDGNDCIQDRNILIFDRQRCNFREQKRCDQLRNLQFADLSFPHQSHCSDQNKIDDQRSYEYGNHNITDFSPFLSSIGAGCRRYSSRFDQLIRRGVDLSDLFLKKGKNF